MTDWIRGINNATDYLASGCNDSTTSLTVLDAAAEFGSPAPDFFELTIWDADTYPQWESDPAGEIVLVTDVTGNVLTVVRGQGGTVGAAHPAGARCDVRFTAEALQQVQAEVDTKTPLTTFDDLQRYGFLNQTETTISFNDSTYLFTLADAGAGWSYFRSGTKYTVTGNKTVTVASPPVDGTTYYVYIDATDGTLSAGTSAWTLNDTKVPVASLKWHSGLTPKYLLSEERHSCLIDRRQHIKEHLTEGTKIASGGTLVGTYATSTDADAAKAFGIAETVIFDEDLRQVLSALAEPDGATAVYPIIYRTAAAAWAWELSEMPFRYTVAGYIQYDNAGTMTEGAGNKYVNTWLLCSNISGAYRFSFVHGRSLHSTAAAAYGESFPALTGYPTPEVVAVQQLTWSTSASHSSRGKCVLDRAQAVQVNYIAAAVSGTTDHNLLAGLQGGTSAEYYHLTAAEYAGLGGGTGDVTGPAGATAGNFASYADATGKALADSGSKAADFATAAHTHAQLHDRLHEATAAADHGFTGAGDGSALTVQNYTDGYTQSILHMEGADGGTTFTDGVTGVSWTAAGGAHTESDDKKFGSTSLAMDGTGDWISTSNATLNTTLGSKNFTIEFWVKLSANGTQQVFCGQGGGVGNWNDTGGGHGWIFFKGSDNKFYFQYHTTGVGGVGTVSSASTYTIAGTWTHLAVVQNGGTVTVYKDGTSVASGAVSSVNYSTGGTQGFYVGTDAAADTPVNGYMDEFRFSVGVARWTANFTPETAAYASGQYLSWANSVNGLTIQKAAAASTAEQVAKFSVADDPTAYLEVANFAATDAVFAAMIRGIGSSTSYAPVNIVGTINADSGSQPAGVFDGRLAAAALTTRPLFDFRNYGTSKFKVWYNGKLTLADAADLEFATTTGTKIGTSTSQKLAFYNATPIVQRSGAAQAAVGTTAATQTTPYGYATQAQADAIVTLVNECRAALVALGLIKGSA